MRPDSEIVVPDRLQSGPMERGRLLEIAICSLGGLIFGYDLGAISTASLALRQVFHLTPILLGTTLSASLWGTVAGAMVSGRVADAVGRRALISGSALLYALAALSYTAWGMTQWHVMIGARFLCGMAIGGFSVGCPLYLAEIAPIAKRGRIVALFQLQVGIGVVLAFTLGRLLDGRVGAEAYWRWCLGAAAVPAVALFALFARRWSFEAGIAARPQEEGSFQSFRDGPGGERLFQRKYRRPLALAASIAIFNQLTGVNILVLYVLEVLSSAGVRPLLSHTYTIFLSVVSLVATLVGMHYVDRLGRKPLLILGSIGMSGCLLGLAATIPAHWLPLWYLGLLVTYNCFFAFSQGTVVWVYLSELFPAGVRGAGQSFGVSVHWIANALLILVFPMLDAASPSLVFYGLAAAMMAQIVVVALWYPETRHKMLGSIAVPLRPN